MTNLQQYTLNYVCTLRTLIKSLFRHATIKNEKISKGLNLKKILVLYLNNERLFTWEGQTKAF